MPIVDVASHRIDYRRIGTACAHRPTLVFLHEGLGSIARWRDFPDRVAQAANCDAVVYSRYGYGNSDPLAVPRTAHHIHRDGGKEPGARRVAYPLRVGCAIRLRRAATARLLI
jgi:pimeloyl-ACP methyl ester carboxylesterase